MSIKVEAGRRSVEFNLEVDGTPEEVWAAIATGEGISSWCMPSTLERSDGKPSVLKMTFGPGAEGVSRVTSYDEPRYFALETDSWIPGSPPIAAEWYIEAKSGSSCKLRIVQSLFASTDDWDGQLEALDSGWSAFLATLRIYLKHFRGQRSTLKRYMAPTAGTEAEVWDKLMRALALKDASIGQRWATPAGLPALAGVPEYKSEVPYDALVRIDSPGSAIAAFGTVDMGGPTLVGMNLYVYGDGVAETAEREGAQWQAWFQEHFPAPPEGE